MTTPANFLPSAPSASEVLADNYVDTRDVEGTPAEEVTGTIHAEQKFESNLKRLFSSEEGVSQLRTWTVRILSTVLVFPVVLAAITDAGRYLGYVAGKHYASLGKIFTGKSFSLVNAMSEGGKSLASKVQEAYKKWMTPKVETLEEMNQKSQTAIKSCVAKLVDHFKALNGNFLFGYSSYTTPGAIEAEKGIARDKQKLIELVNTYLDQNKVGASDFAEKLNDIKEKIVQMIVDQAGDEPYIPHKAYRDGPRYLLSRVIAAELNVAFQTALPKLFVEAAKKEGSFEEGLKIGVEQQILTPAEAKVALTQRAQEAFSQELETSLSKASAAEKQVFQAGVEKGIVSETEVEKSLQQNRPSLDILVAAAAKEIAEEQAEADEVLVKAQVSKMADQLIEDQKITPEKKTSFATRVYNQVVSLLAEKEEKRAQEAAETPAQKRARIKAEKEEAKRVEEARLAQVQREKEAQAAEEKRVAEVQKAEAQASLMGKFGELLGVISKKQDEVEGLLKERDTLRQQGEELIRQLEEIENKRVDINNKNVSILEAFGVYRKELHKIYTKKNSNDHQRNEEIKALKKLGFNDEIIKLIKQIQPLSDQIDALYQQMEETSTKITARYQELQTLFQVYMTFRGLRLKDLEKVQQEAVRAQDRPMRGRQEKIVESYNRALKVDFFDTLKSPQVNKDPVVNLTEVEQIIEANRAPVAPPIETAPPSAPSAPEEAVSEVADGEEDLSIEPASPSDNSDEEVQDKGLPVRESGSAPQPLQRARSLMDFFKGR